MKFAPLLSALCLFSLCAAPTVAEEQKPAPPPMASRSRKVLKTGR